MRQQTSAALSEWQRAFVKQHRLSKDYLNLARQWFDPLSDAIKLARDHKAKPLLVGINGCQGSGKSTLSDYLQQRFCNEFGLTAVALSLDDVYHTKAVRQRLAQSVHPLLVTRGVPGTHEMSLLADTLDQLLGTSSSQTAKVKIPRFDKARDDRFPRSHWPEVDAPVDIVLLEGWCLGAMPEEDTQLNKAINTLEQQEDADLIWRRFVNEAIREQLLPFYEKINLWVMLQAPSFDCVFSWRQEQERKLRESKGANAANNKASSAVMGDVELKRFVAHFERQTRQCLKYLPAKVNYLYHLNEAREVVSQIVDKHTRFNL